MKTRRSIHGALLAICAASSLIGCSGTPQKTTPTVAQKTETVDSQVTPSSQAQNAAKELDRDIVSTITFKPESRGVPVSASEELDRAINEAHQRGEIQSIDVVVWSDRRYPAQGRKLSRKQVAIAEDRGENIEKYLNTRDPAASVRIHNMAKHPNALSELLKTEDAALKDKLVAMGVASPNKGELEDRSSSALVFIKVK